MENNPQSPENDGEAFERIRDYLEEKKRAQLSEQRNSQTRTARIW